MSQNIYDDPDFFAAYGALPRSQHGFDGAPEWPVLRGMLPPMDGVRVLDLGCGYGWFARWARAQGAAEVVAVDLSQRMLERARAAGTDSGITYRRADLEAFDPAGAEFDLVYSSLALHYVADLAGLLRRVKEALAPGAALVFSTEHPLLTDAPDLGWIEREGGPLWPVRAYLDEGPRESEWLGARVVKQHRTIATWLDLLREAGFALERLVEWGPDAEQIARHPEWARERARPFFLLVSARAA